VRKAVSNPGTKMKNTNRPNSMITLANIGGERESGFSSSSSSISSSSSSSSSKSRNRRRRTTSGAEQPTIIITAKAALIDGSL